MTAYLSKKIKVLNAVSILLIVYIHSCNLHIGFLTPSVVIRDDPGANSLIQYFISNGVCRVGVPLLFAISGFLFFRQGWFSIAAYKDKLKDRAYTLLLPYLFWCLLWIALLLLIEQVPPLYYLMVEGKIVAGDATRVQHYTLPDYWYRLAIAVIPFQFWFLKDLILFTLISPVVYLAVRYIPYLLLAVLGWLWITEFHRYYYNSEAGFFFCLGALAAVRRVSIPPPRNKVLIRLLLFAWLLLLCVKTIIAASPDFTYYGITAQLFLERLHKVSIITGTLAVWWNYDLLQAYIRPRGLLLKLAGLSFILFALHEPAMNMVSAYILGGYPSAQLLIYLLLPVFIIAVCLAAGVALRRYTPSLYRIMTGGRQLEPV
jgi:peptidoglycan/LPS O-acetylase OafA/YrhL